MTPLAALSLPSQVPSSSPHSMTPLALHAHDPSLHAPSKLHAITDLTVSLVSRRQLWIQPSGDHLDPLTPSCRKSLCPSLAFTLTLCLYNDMQEQEFCHAHRRGQLVSTQGEHCLAEKVNFP
jgi:hypothetical protein